MRRLSWVTATLGELHMNVADEDVDRERETIEAIGFEVTVTDSAPQ